MKDWNDYWKPGQWWGTPQVYGACQVGKGIWTHGWTAGIKILATGERVAVICDKREHHYTVTKGVKSSTEGLAFIPLRVAIGRNRFPNGALVTIPGRVA